ncbi:1,4-alpha-glucan branching protein [Streptomyces sp. ST2-7A]|uniref:CG0192-related protein n=1 Tax=Streptomyces sp. ST2-7A TaxID=2907214 RepID=UPI001F344579|nr:1,4-alpha-glucan branching protein [Streptomyces sp. ST2-7A]MCE7081365.1 1,4-alpha-glucan branching protein [Streptomyces sp. ST2-7A]
MALIYKATLTPGKLDLLGGWLPHRPWSAGSSGFRQVGAYRFDDPAGEVGLEAFLLEADDGTLLHVPVTYRGAPLEGADEFLIGTTEHSVLGTRWVYDGCGDPVGVTAMIRGALGQQDQAEEVIEADGHRESREPTVRVRADGDPGTPAFTGIDTVACRNDGPTTVVHAGEAELVVVRTVGADITPADATLTGRWSEGGPVVLAGVRSQPTTP